MVRPNRVSQTAEETDVDELRPQILPMDGLVGNTWEYNPLRY